VAARLRAISGTELVTTFGCHRFVPVGRLKFFAQSRMLVKSLRLCGEPVTTAYQGKSQHSEDLSYSLQRFSWGMQILVDTILTLGLLSAHG
jgi:hypothetical protein